MRDKIPRFFPGDGISAGLLQMEDGLSTVFITQDKIPSPSFLQLYVSKLLRLEELTEDRDILLLNGYVQVIMRAGLLTKERINAPSTIDPDFDA